MLVVDEKLGIGNLGYYQEYYGNRPPDHYMGLLATIIKHGRPGNLLDLGCGTGLFLEMALRWGLDVIGCDGSEDALRMALSRNPSLRLANSMFSDQLPFSASAFDNILLNQVIEHLPASVLSNLLLECKRVLRTKGMLFIYSPNKADKDEVSKDPTHLNPLYPSELRALLLSTGFEVVAEPNWRRFGTKNRVLRLLLSRLPETFLRDWLSASSNAYARKP